MVEEFREMGAGSLEAELREVERLEKNSEGDLPTSVTVGCGAFLSLICC